METNEAWKSGLDYLGVICEYDIRALARKLVKPTPSHSSKQYQPASLDLTVGAIITPETVIDLNSGAKDVRLAPGGVATILTQEELHLPIDFIGTAFAINVLSHRGLLVLNSGHIDPGYRGVLAVKLVNLQKTSYTLRLGDPIFTVVFDRIAKDAEPYSGRYLNLQERIDFIRGAVENTAPAALLDIHGDGLKHVIDKAVYNDIERYQNTVINVAKNYDDALRESLKVRIDNLEKLLKTLEDETIKKHQLGKAIWSDLKTWILGLIILGAAIAEILSLIFNLLK